MRKKNTIHYLSDYKPSDYLIDSTDLTFDIWDEFVDVTAVLRMRANYLSKQIRPLMLNGDNLELLSIALNNKDLVESEYVLDDKHLTIAHPPQQFVLTIKTRIYPAKNKALMGLYKTQNVLCTQCEPHGFQGITYYLDRPDVMAVFTTTIIADAKKFPLLLSNGNKVDKGTLPEGRHWVKWSDPFKKPCYLFALVAGKLACVQGTFTTASGRKVSLQLYTEKENRDKCDFALRSLQAAMRWDEQVFGLEYDLDIYMIVAVNDFNMGAMENKGLNIFNSRYILANSAIATDTDYQDIEKVVAHEYFHNWTGNRVTLRDWFQLSLKEGLTVFRDQEFSAYQWSTAVKRIEDVKIIKTSQFAEDAGPLAHSVRPKSYIKMDNFYTLTVYNKGAEVVRMLYRLLGANGFRHGMDLYFSRFDGHAVTTDDFVRAMSDANHKDLEQFKRWYSQAGTPVLEVDWKYDAHYHTLTLNVSQTCPETPGQPEKLPFHLPLAMALLDEQGNEMALNLAGGEKADTDEFILNITKSKHQFHFYNIPSKPVPSLLRGFSAPVRLNAPYTKEELLFLLIHDKDPVSRWQAAQNLISKEVDRLLQLWEKNEPLALAPELINTLKEIVNNKRLDASFAALLFQLPDPVTLAAEREHIDVDGLFHVYKMMCSSLAHHLKEDLVKTYEANHSTSAYHIDANSVAKRSLKNTCLRYLGRIASEDELKLIEEQYYQTDNMTDRLAALQAINHSESPLRDTLLAHFATQWHKEPLVLDKWFALQAVSELPSTLENVEKLLHHPYFLRENPNKLYALLVSFSQRNPYHFHEVNGKGYRLVADEIIRIDAFNPHVAARLVTAFASWRKYDEKRQKLMKMELKRILASPAISGEVNELVSKTLA